MATNSALISWKTKKQSLVALSTCEAEFISITFEIKEGKFLRQLLADMINEECSSFNLHIDNQGAIKLAQNPLHHQRSKHVEVKYFYIRQEIDSGIVNPLYIPSEENISDIFTKPLTKAQLRRFNISG